MGEVTSHRDLVVWQKAMDLATLVYRISAGFPRMEVYGLTAQLRRAVVSVPANIAEGSVRGSTRDYAHFLGIAKGSLMETETLLMLSTRLEYLSDVDATPALSLIGEVSKMLTAMRAKLSR